MRKRQAFVCSNCEASFSEKPAPSMPRGQVFLSYGHDPACTSLVERLKMDLRAQGWEPWQDDERIEYGDDWRRSITDAVLESRHMLAFLSKHSTRKPGVCRQEVAIALGRGQCHVYTVLVEPLSEVTPPLLVSGRQWLDMQQWRMLQNGDTQARETLYSESLKKILQVLERNEPFAGEVEELRTWLDPLPEAVADMISVEEGFTGREWLLGGIGGGGEPDRADNEATGEIERWRIGGSENRVLWIAAGPGWGKTAVAARLAHAGRARVMAVHFCRHDQPLTRDVRRMVRTIAFQMATQLEEYRRLLVALARRGEALQELSPAELFHRLLADPLAHVIEGGRGVHDRHLIVLDALDEALDADGRSELVTLVAAEFGKLPAWLGLLVTSRPEAPVKRQLGGFGVLALETADTRNLDDVRQFTQMWLAKKPLSPEQSEQALRAVMQASEGNFLYVRKLRDAVQEGVIGASQLVDATALPQGLSSLYERWFQRRFPEPEHYDKHQRPLLEMMLAAREPLPLELAGALLAWGAYGRSALEPLGSLCVERDGALSFFHKSLRDWLGDPERCGWTFHASETEGHERLAKGIWRAFEAWQAAGAALHDPAGWAALGGRGEAYSLRHLPAHLAAASRSDDRRRLLTDFGFAMRRAAAGFIDALLDDYRGERARALKDPLGSWAECLMKNAHLLKRGADRWPAERILLQVAVEEADDSAITQAAELWLEQGHCDWVWLKSRTRPKQQARSPLLAVLEGHTERVNGAQVLPNGRILSWSNDNTLRLWDGESGAALAVLEGHTDWINGAQVLPDGRILSWSHDNTLRLWDGASGAALAVLEGHTKRVNGAKVLPNGRILSSSADNTLRLWDGASGVMLAAYPAQSWVENTPFPCPWESLNKVASASRTNDLWSGSRSDDVYLASRKVGWIAHWQGNGLRTFGVTANTLIAGSGRHLLFLELMRGGQPLDYRTSDSHN